MLFLQMFDYTIEYRPGKCHSNADALSRRPSGGDGGGEGDGGDSVGVVETTAGGGEGDGGDSVGVVETTAGEMEVTLLG